MKKTLAALVALMMALLCTIVLAEEKGPDSEATKLFSSTWASGNTRVDVSNNDGLWEVEVKTEFGTTVWNYTCVYDAELNSLVSVDDAENTKRVMTLDDEHAETGSEIVDAEAKATFTLDEDGLLLWKDEKNDEGAGVTFEKIGWFEGYYYCDDYSLSCTWEADESGDEAYTVVIDLENEDGVTEWVYRCTYDAESNALASVTGTKEFSANDTEAFEILSEDGSAVFTKDEEGNLLWNDEAENAGEGLVFILPNG